MRQWAGLCLGVRQAEETCGWNRSTWWVGWPFYWWPFWCVAETELDGEKHSLGLYSLLDSHSTFQSKAKSHFNFLEFELHCTLFWQSSPPNTGFLLQLHCVMTPGYFFSFNLKEKEVQQILEIQSNLINLSKLDIRIQPHSQFKNNQRMQLHYRYIMRSLKPCYVFTFRVIFPINLNVEKEISVKTADWTQYIWPISGLNQRKKFFLYLFETAY